MKRPTVVILTKEGESRVLGGIAGSIFTVWRWSQAPGCQLMAHVTDARFAYPDGRPQIWSLGDTDYLMPKAGE